MCSLGIEPTTFCAADAMLYHWATGTLYSLQFQKWSVKLIFVFRLQPSHADKAADPKVLKWMTDLTKIRKQLKGKSVCVGRGGDMGVHFLIGRVICYWEVWVQTCSPVLCGRSAPYTACL